MAWNGTAQVDTEGVFIKIIVKGDDGLQVAEFLETLDETHIGGQIKIDILETRDLSQPIPDDMIQNPDTCTLVLVTETGTRNIGNFDRLIKFEKDFDGRKVHLEILSPGTDIKEPEMDLEGLKVVTRPAN